MDVTDEEGTKELLELRVTDCTSPLPEDVVALVEESFIDNCSRDTDGSLSRFNVDFLNDFHDPPKPARGRRKKTMDEERMSFKHVVDKAISYIEDDVSSISSFTSVDSDYSPPPIKIKKNVDNRFSEYRFRDVTLASKSKDTKGINRIKGKKSRYLKKLPKMKRIYPEVEKDVLTASTSRGYTTSNLNKAMLSLKSDEEQQSKSDNEKNLDRLANVVDVDLFKQKRKKSLLLSKSAEEQRRNYEEGKSENKEGFVMYAPSIGEHMIVSNSDKRILLSPKSDKEEKSKSYIEDVDTPLTIKYTNIPKEELGGVKRILISETEEEENSKFRKEQNFIDRFSSVAKNAALRRNRRVSGKRREVGDNAHIYNFFSSMADLVSTMPYSTTLTAKARVTKVLTEMVERVEKLQMNRLLTPISEENLKLIKLRLSRLPYIY